MNANIELTDDYNIVNAILARNREVTRQFLYVKCYPLFKSVFDNYYTDCESCIEFINEIYIHLMTPNPKTGECKLQSFKFGSSLITWLKTVAVFYCYERYRRKQKITFVEEKNDGGTEAYDRYPQSESSINEEGYSLGDYDMEALLNLMPNKRYGMIIRMLYVEGLTNEETANALQLGMANFYNLHSRAKQQFNDVLKKEGSYGELL